MHCGKWVLLSLVNGNRKDRGYRFDLVFELIAKVGECIEENIFNVPKLFRLELLDLLMTWKHILVIKIDDRPLVVMERFDIKGKTTKLNIIERYEGRGCPVIKMVL